MKTCVGTTQGTLICTIAIASGLLALTSVSSSSRSDYHYRGLDIGSIFDQAPNNGTEIGNEWDPQGDNFINLPVEECDAKDVVNQTDFAELRYLNMHPPCEMTPKGYCGIRRYQNISLVSKFVTKTYNDVFRVRVHLVDKNFGFETILWPEFGACHPFFNITCPQEPDMVHSFVFSEIPKEIPPTSVIIRVRLISVNENQEKNVAICKQIKLQII